MIYKIEKEKINYDETSRILYWHELAIIDIVVHIYSNISVLIKKKNSNISVNSYFAKEKRMSEI